MKRALLFAFMMFAGRLCFADASNVTPSFVYETAVSSGNTVIIAVSSTNVTQVDNPQLVSRASIEVQNIDATANLWCVVVSSITPTVPAANNGRKIAPGGSWFPNFLSTISIVSFSTTTQSTTTTQTAAKIWCISDSTSATSKAAVTQAY